jgi:Ca2+-binding RTX toxin-like protein
MPIGTPCDDILTGNNLDEYYDGLDGNDILNGSGGSDILNGGLGKDTADYSLLGSLVTLGAFGQVQKSGLGVDTLIDIERVVGSNLLGDTINLSGAVSGNGFTVTSTTTDLTSGYVTVFGSPTPNPFPLTISIANFENVIGSNFNDVIIGNSSDNVINGGLGADSMSGGSGNDTYVVDNVGDSVTEAAAAGTDKVLSSITYTLGVNLENLTLTGTANINGTGNSLNNTITGNGANNTLVGAQGSDTLTGLGGFDIFKYASVSESAFGVLNRDTIMDFTVGADKLDLSAIDANITANAPLDQQFNFLGAATTFSNAGQLRYQVSGSDLLLFGNIDGDVSTAEFEIKFNTLTSLTAASIIL